MIQNKVNGRFYVGSAVDLTRHWHRHRYYLKRGDHHNYPLQHAWNKYGEENFHFSILVYCEVTDLIAFEQMAIDRLGATDIGYNLCPVAGSVLGKKFKKRGPLSAERRAAISKSREGFTHTDETKKQIGDTQRGKPKGVYSEETKKKISESQKGKKQTQETVEKRMQAHRGKKRSEETKRKISEGQKGRVSSPETIAKRVHTYTRNRLLKRLHNILAALITKETS